MINDELKYHLLKLLENDPNLSQRAISKEMGISLGKVNYCLHALMDKGIIKARNFYKNKNKVAYTYYLTPKGFEEKGTITFRFLQSKISEYENLRTEIEEIRKEASALNEKRNLE